MFSSPEGHKTVLGTCPSDGDVFFARRTLPARAVYFAVDLLLWMDGACLRVFGSDRALGSATGVMGGDLQNNEPTPYPDNFDGNDWYFADVPVDSVDSRTDVLGRFPETWTPFAINAVQPMLQYPRTQAASLAWPCRT